MSDSDYYDVLSHEPNDDFLSTRSICYRLEPIARGTARRESLTSLTLRLACAHRLGLLRFADLIADCIGADPKVVNHAIDRTYGDGGGKMAALLARGLTALTGHASLDDLTFLPIGAAKTSVRLTPSVYRWCPQCFSDDIAAGGTPYGRLIWSLAPNQVCHVHDATLCSLCPKCAGRARRLNVKALPNVCRSCGGDLGRATSPGRPDSQQLQRGRLVAALLDDPGYDLLTREVAGRNLQAFVELAVKERFAGRYSRLAKFLGISLITVRSWITRQAVPTIGNVVLLSEALQSPLIDIYMGDTQRISMAAGPRARSARSIRPRIKRGSARDREVELGLAHVLATHPPLTIKEAAEKLNVSINYLKARFPDSCSQLRDKALSMRRAERAALREETLSLFRQTAETIAASGRIPTVRNIFEVDGRFRTRRVGFLNDAFNAILDEVRASMRHRYPAISDGE